MPFTGKKYDTSYVKRKEKSKYVTRSDKRVTRCQFGHSELLIPTDSAYKELYIDIGFRTVHNAKVKLWPLKVRW